MTHEESTASPRVSRRQLIIGGAGAALIAGLGVSLSTNGRGLLDALPFVGGDKAPLDRTPMAARIGETFTTKTDDGDRVVLTLAAIDDLPAAANTDNAEGQFVARFHGPADRPLPQNTYRFDTDSFGGVDVFVVPGAANAEFQYSATFNRMLEVMP
jgi:hypothetical protein